MHKISSMIPIALAAIDWPLVHCRTHKFGQSLLRAHSKPVSGGCNIMAYL